MPTPLATLVTGSAGRIGQAVCAELLRRGHRVRGWDLKATPGVADSRIGDLRDPASIECALEGIAAVVHLAATPDDYDFLSALLPNNVVGLYHVLEACRKAGVKRLALASTGQLGHAGPFPVSGTTLPTPPNLYASTKVFAEAAARVYALRYGIRTVALRCGWCPRTGQDAAQIAASSFGQNTYLSPGDAGRAFACALETEGDFRFAAFYVTSRTLDRTYFSLDEARALIGFEPRDRWPEGLEK